MCNSVSLQENKVSFYTGRQITVKYNGRVIFIFYLDPRVFTVGWICRLVPIIQLPNLNRLITIML